MSVVNPGVVSFGRGVVVTVMMLMLTMMLVRGHPEVVQYELGEARVQLCFEGLYLDGDREPNGIEGLSSVL